MSNRVNHSHPTFVSFPTLGGSQILTPEGFLNKIKGLSDGGDEPSDE